MFEKWHQVGEHAAQSGEQLAELVGCDPILLRKRFEPGMKNSA